MCGCSVCAQTLQRVRLARGGCVWHGPMVVEGAAELGLPQPFITNGPVERPALAALFFLLLLFLSFSRRRLWDVAACCVCGAFDA